jgi:RNA polymerase-binding transcription factor DksA
MSRFEVEARDLLLKRRESLRRGPGEARPGDPCVNCEAQPDAVGDTERRELADIDAALRRIEEGKYGRCEACGGPMGLQRMRAIPEARFCLSCSGHREGG